MKAKNVNAPDSLATKKRETYERKDKEERNGRFSGLTFMADLVLIAVKQGLLTIESYG